MTSAALTALLDYIEAEERRWEEWFAAHPEALDLPTGRHDAPALRDLLLHIVAVELRNAQRLAGESQTHPEKDAAPQPFAIARQRRELMRRLASSLNEDELQQPRAFHSPTFGDFSATPLKLLLHGMLHGVRHWAQLATLLRQHGYGDLWKHDVLFSQALP